MEIEKKIKTKYGVVNAKFIFDGNVWIASIDHEVMCVVIQANSLTHAQIKVVEIFEVGYKYAKIYENNPHKNKVQRELLTDLINKKQFWKLQKN